jgi:hypothetical protein
LRREGEIEEVWRGKEKEKEYRKTHLKT